MARYNPNDERQFQRLRESLEQSRKQLKKFSNQYIQNLRQYVGRRYGESGTSDKMPINMLRQAVDIWGRKLVTQAPAALVTTRNFELKPRAIELGLALEHLFQEINFADTLQHLAKMALMGFGAIKVGIAPTTHWTSENYRFDPGQPYAEPILVEDWFHDITARRVDEWDFAGNRYRVDYEDLMENPEFNEAAKREISPNESGDATDFGEGEENRSNISSGDENSWDKDDYRQKVELQDIWLPMDGLIVTSVFDNPSRPLLVREWEGPENGPYDFLAFCSVPGNILPSEPASLIYDMNEALNQMVCKVIRQGHRQRTIALVDQVAASDGTGKNIVEAEDGDYLTVQRPDSAKEINLGGVNQNSMALAVWLRQMASYMGGNIDLIGGLSAQSSTARQDQILAESSSELVSHMQGTLEAFTRRVTRSLGWYLYHDPLIQLPLTKRMAGGAIERTIIYGPEAREADFYEFNLDIQPYTMRSQSPEQRLEKLLKIVTQVVAPMLPMLAQQGTQLNMRHLMKLISRYGNLPELEECLIDNMMPLMNGMQGPTHDSTGKPANSERRYVRENVATGGTGPSRDNILMQSLMSGSSQVTPQQLNQMSQI